MTKRPNRGPVRLRAATREDIPQLVRLENRCFTSYYSEHKFSAADFLYYLKDKRTLARVAETNKGLAGYILGVVHTGRLRHLARIHSIAVMPDQRGKGLGRRLMQGFLRAARNKNCKKVLLEVALANTRGLAFFTRLGFKRFRSLPDYYGKGLHGLRMSMKI